LGNASSAVVIGDTATAVAAGFNFGAAVQNDRGLSIIAGTGAADRIISTTISSGTATQAGTVVMATNATYSATSGGRLNVSGVISGAGNALITNSGTVVFSGTNTYSGTTTVGSNSTLVAASSTALGGAGTTTVNNGGTLSLSNNISEDEAITISGAGVGGVGALRSISGDNTNTGTISLGSLTNVIAAVTGSTLTLSNIDTVATSNNLTVSANGTVRVLGSILTAGSITNVLQKDGAGALVISNNGTTGGIQLQVGNGSVTLAAGSFSTNTSITGSEVSPRAIDLGITSTGDSTNNVAFYANSGVTVSNSFYVAPNTNNATRTIGTENGSGIATFSSQIYLGGTARLFANNGGTALFSGDFVNGGNLVKVGEGTVRLAGNNSIGDSPGILFLCLCRRHRAITLKLRQIWTIRILHPPIG
jgi:autotransporter-associated beta strand protein